jgi:hypothetical protein
MSKAQTDIRTTSYDANQANSVGYHGTIDDALSQIRSERQFPVTNRARAELLKFLGANKEYAELSGAVDTHSCFAGRDGILAGGPSVELDQDVSYGAEDVTLGVYDPGFYGLAHAKARGWL